LFVFIYMMFTLEHALILILALAVIYYVIQHRNLLTDLSSIPDRDHPELKAVKGKHMNIFTDVWRFNDVTFKANCDDKQPLGSKSFEKCSSVTDNNGNPICYRYDHDDKKCSEIRIRAGDGSGGANGYTKEQAKKVCETNYLTHISWNEDAGEGELCARVYDNTTTVDQNKLHPNQRDSTGNKVQAWMCNRGTDKPGYQREMCCFLTKTGCSAYK